MYYFYQLVLPPNTSKINPVVMTMPVHAGLLSYIEVEFPGGCSGYAHTQIKYHSRQLLPFNPPGDLYGDSRIFKPDLNFPLTEPPHEFVAWGWNEDDTYQHIVSIGIMVQDTNKKSFAELLLEG